MQTVKRLYRQHKRELEQAGRWHKGPGTRTYMQSYVKGLVRSINRKLMGYVESPKRTEEIKSTGYDIIKIKSDELEKWYKERTKDFNQKQSDGRTNFHGWTRGIVDGEHVQIHPTLNEAKQTKFLDR